MTNPADEWEDVFMGKTYPIDLEHDDLMTLQDWKDSVECGGFIDYDGYGHLATEKFHTDIVITPSMLEGFNFPSWCTHIIWYNR